MWSIAVAALAFSAPVPATLRLQPAASASPVMLFGFGGGGAAKGSTVELEIKTMNGVKMAKGIAGEPMMKSMGSSGIKYGCKEGQCGTCEVKVDGRTVRTCVAKLPNKASIKVDVTQNTVLKGNKNSNW